jgi:hypothetical protein
VRGCLARICPAAAVPRADQPAPRFILLPLNFFLLVVTLAALVGVWAK